MNGLWDHAWLAVAGFAVGFLVGVSLVRWLDEKF